MYISLWVLIPSLVLLALFIYAWTKICWKVGHVEGYEARKRDEEIEKGTEELHRALWPIRRINMIEKLKKGLDA